MHEHHCRFLLESLMASLTVSGRFFPLVSGKRHDVAAAVKAIPINTIYGTEILMSDRRMICGASIPPTRDIIEQVPRPRFLQFSSTLVRNNHYTS